MDSELKWALENAASELEMLYADYGDSQDERTAQILRDLLKRLEKGEAEIVSVSRGKTIGVGSLVYWYDDDRPDLYSVVAMSEDNCCEIVPFPDGGEPFSVRLRDLTLSVEEWISDANDKMLDALSYENDLLDDQSTDSDPYDVEPPMF